MQKLNYNPSIKEKIRLKKIIEKFSTVSQYEPRFFVSPGRIELIGNHTDHNGGAAIGAAIDKNTMAAAAINNSNTINIYSFGYEAVTIDISDTEIKNSEYGTVNAIVRGIINGFKEMNIFIGGFDAVIDSDVPVGAGMSSSASFELIIAVIINNLFNDGKTDKIALAQLCQQAENNYFGKPCGMLDQLAIISGGLTYMDFSGKKIFTEKITNNINDISFLLVNTKGNHTELTEYYADISKDMERVAHYFNKEKLIEVDKTEFLNNYRKLYECYGGLCVSRAVHFIEENTRVKNTREAIIKGDKKAFLHNINLSGISSDMLLQNYYVPTDKIQPLTIGYALYNLVEQNGACRIHGGGFAGTLLCVCCHEELKKEMGLLYGTESIYECSISDNGTTEIEFKLETI